MKSEKTTPAASIFEKQYLTVSEIRSYLNVSMTTAYELVHRKDFPVAYFGSNIRIPTGPFLAWVESRTHIPDDLNKYMRQRRGEEIPYAG